LKAVDVRALVDDAGLGDGVDVVVSPTDERVKALMRTSSFVASASEYEGFGMAAIEGMSAGLIPLLSGIPPFRRLVARSGQGMIIDYSDPEAGARRLLRSVASIGSNYVGHRAACMKAALAYDWRRVCAEFAKLYDVATGTKIRTILDVPIQVRTFEEAVRSIDACYEKGEPVAVAFANAHALNVAAENPAFRQALQNSLVLNDGIGVDVASRLFYGSPFPENLNGTDFSPNYLRQTKHRYRIFLLGANPGVAERAGQRLSALCPWHRIVGCQHGHFNAEKAPEIVEQIRRVEADILLVAMGNPKQELFLQDHLAATGCTLGIGVGALFDFLAGQVPRATPWVRRWRLEWAYRLAREPRRLARRYLVGNPLFLMRIARQWWSGARVKNAEPGFGRSGARETPDALNIAIDRNIAAQEAMSARARTREPVQLPL
jgi:alpha-1,3-mannosyltransferase